MMSATDDDPVLSLSDVTVEFGREPLINELIPGPLKRRLGLDESERVRAVDGVSLDIGEEDVVAIVGESGSGKTTLGKVAVALREPTAGQVVYRGHDVWDVHGGRHDSDIFFEDIRKALQIVHQDPSAALNPYRTVMATLQEPLKIWFPELAPADRRERILRLFEACGLTPAQEFENRYPHELSGGEKQRVVLLRAMLVEPDVIMADEPVSALDPSLRVDIMDLMLDLQEVFSTSFIFISHNLEHARYVAGKADGRIAIMYQGEIVEFGPAEEIIQDPKHPYTQVLKWSTLPLERSAAEAALSEELPLRDIDLPDPAARPSGCRFHPRCPKARMTCAATNPDLTPVATNGREVACFREQDDHEYWQSEFIDDRGELEIPE